MDKFEKILDIIDHQEKYTDEEIREILQDEECHKLYQTLQEVDSALLKHQVTEADVDEAWEKFSEDKDWKEEEVLKEEGLKEGKGFSWRKIAAFVAGFVLISGIAFAAIHTYIRKSQEPMPIAENTEQAAVGDSVKNDTAQVTMASAAKTEKPAIHKTFENVAFGKMMAEIAAYHDLQVKFESDEAKSLRLYYEWDSHTRIEDVIKELNQFENVDIALQGNEIIVK